MGVMSPIRFELVSVPTTDGTVELTFTKQQEIVNDLDQVLRVHGLRLLDVNVSGFHRISPDPATTDEVMYREFDLPRDAAFPAPVKKPAKKRARAAAPAKRRATPAKKRATPAKKRRH